MKREALLLLGPTGAGKTPLGERLHGTVVGGCRYAHFDFGARLRQVVSGENTCGLSTLDRNFLVEVLRSGALLENDTFHLARRIIEDFLESDGRGADVVVLNGLPRHVGQAKDVDGLFDVRTVLVLRCEKEVVLARILSNSGGDRSGRQDDDLRLVEQKLRTFASRTAPLVAHYNDRGARLVEFDVTVDTDPDRILAVVHP